MERLQSLARRRARTPAAGACHPPGSLRARAGAALRRALLGALALGGAAGCQPQYGQTGLQLNISLETPADCIQVRARKPGGVPVSQQAPVPPASDGVWKGRVLKVLVYSGGALGADEVDLEVTGSRGGCEAPPVARVAIAERFKRGEVRDLEVRLRATGPDADADGWPDAEDCGPTDPLIHPRDGEEASPAECDGADNNCNGSVDEGCECTAARPCYPLGMRHPTLGVGLCRAGTQPCQGNQLGRCSDYVLPAAETCEGGDRDCDGAEGLPSCPCDEGATRPCYVAGPASAAGRGICAAGAQTCVRGFWAACAGDVPPARESCNGRDDDCDGTTDNFDLVDTPPCDNQGGACFGARRACVGGQAAPICNDEDYNRAARANGAVWTKVEEASHCDTVDNDCDGNIDEGCSCTKGAVEPCHPLGAANPRGAQGVCRRGQRRCGPDERWGECEGAVGPQAETCNGLDDDCDGLVDDDVPGAGGACEAGRPGVCARGERRCVDGAVACASVQPAGTEVCDGLDNDCDGTVDEGFEKSTDPLNCGGPADCRKCPEGSACCAGRCSDPAADPLHCGGCGRACAPGQACCAAGCVDVADDNANCGRCGNSCGGGRVCRAGECAPSREDNCANGFDDDHDGDADCADSDCSAGATCSPDGTKGCRAGRCLPRHESACDNADDDDGDGLTDCADGEDCPAATRCGRLGGRARACRQGACAFEAETSCADGLDDDLDGFSDCQDTQDCPPTAVCDARGGACRNGVCAHETSCTDRLDEDGDGSADCADVRDCPPGTACDATGATCAAGTCRHEVTCSDRLDNDADGLADCADPDCPDTVPCAGGGTCCSRSGRKVCARELACTDGVDDDCDGKTDCADPDCTCPGGTQCCGTACRATQTDLAHCGGCNQPCTDSNPCTVEVCQAGQCRHNAVSGRAQAPGCDGAKVCCGSTCAPAVEPPGEDGLDNDCDGRTDCQDPDVGCPAGQACCGRTCKQIASDLQNCGACGAVCNPAVGPCETFACVAGACRVSAKPQGAACAGGACCAADRTCRPTTEAAGVCANALDDDCDGRPDCLDADCAAATQGQTFCANEGRCRDLDLDESACGQCGRPCAAGETCWDGRCLRETTGDGQSVPAQCADATDNDHDERTDCADPDCADGMACGLLKICCGGACLGESCTNLYDDNCNGLVDCLDVAACSGLLCGTGTLGAGASCGADGGCHETSCGDGLDQDRDALVDCADIDCDGRACANGNGLCENLECNLEQVCYDRTDNDHDTSTDCNDVDCYGLPCGTGTAGAGAVCRGAAPPACLETDCGNYVSDDRDGLTDCKDADCVGRLCDGGFGKCQPNGTCLHESNCWDEADGDTDGKTDCADSSTDDCLGKACGTRPAGAGGVCRGDARCHEIDCGNGTDEDADGLFDCADSGSDDCTGRLCATGYGLCLLDGSCLRESVCYDRADNDGDGKTDCADKVAPDCLDKACGLGAAGAGGVCRADGGCHEAPDACGNHVDDDGDGKTDCADTGTGDCTGKLCDAGYGICQANGTCLHESVCHDLVDGDTDGKTDCADSTTDDCLGKACGTGSAGAGGLCRADAACHETGCGNGLDDDRDGKVDCVDSGTDDCTGQLCAAGFGRCQADGSCLHESVCYDGTDNDTDGKIDCADSATDDCRGRACGRGALGAGGVCGADGGCHEAPDACANALDDDGDGLTDCADTGAGDCTGKLCDGGYGICQANGTCLHESVCYDLVDGDTDGRTDCADDSASDCLGDPCGTGALGAGGLCRADGRCHETGCGNGADDDRDGKTDCVDSGTDDCTGQLCAAGFGRCLANGTCLRETTCYDGTDDDADGKTDCQDSATDDCRGRACGTGALGAGGTCRADGSCHEIVCSNGGDDDRDGLVDCLDSGTDDCTGRLCDGGYGICQANGTCLHESVCYDQADGDTDGRTDCADDSASDCLGDPCGTGSLGAGGVCRADGACHETGCGNGADDDRDGRIDCADSGTDDCTGQLCANGHGRCQAAGTCLRESVCWDGTDGDTDGFVDCADNVAGDCLDQPCGRGANGAGGQCLVDGLCHEVACDNATDDDRDNATDCRDADCDGDRCAVGGGAVCLHDELRCRETRCYDQTDNDADAATDCADADCGTNTACGSGPDGAGAMCAGTACEERTCHNLADDDRDTATDCADVDCWNEACGTGADGAGATCGAGSACHEDDAWCDDATDNDRDGDTDCADADCSGALCDDGTGTCDAGLGECIHELACYNAADDDGDALVDCADSGADDCLGRNCAPGGATDAACQADEYCHERNCANEIDDDGDTLADCQDDEDCETRACGTGAGAHCLTGACREDACTDGVDNDGDTDVDCADSDCGGLACGTNRICSGGSCVCTGATCTSAGQCLVYASQDATHCGTAGAACIACAAGQACVNGACVCNAASCPTGCCSGTTCVAPADQSGHTDYGPGCGTGGAACLTCPNGQNCQSTGGGCSTATACPDNKHCRNNYCADGMCCPSGQLRDTNPAGATCVATCPAPRPDRCSRSCVGSTSECDVAPYACTADSECTFTTSCIESRGRCCPPSWYWCSGTGCVQSCTTNCPAHPVTDNTDYWCNDTPP